MQSGGRRSGSSSKNSGLRQVVTWFPELRSHPLNLAVSQPWAPPEHLHGGPWSAWGSGAYLQSRGEASSFCPTPRGHPESPLHVELIFESLLPIPGPQVSNKLRSAFLLDKAPRIGATFTRIRYSALVVGPHFLQGGLLGSAHPSPGGHLSGQTTPPTPLPRLVLEALLTSPLSLLIQWVTQQCDISTFSSCHFKTQNQFFIL